MKVTVAYVDVSSQKVLDLDLMEPNRIPADPEGFRYLAQGRDWAENTKMPVMGDMWEGNIPASFIADPTAVQNPDGPPTNIEEAKARVDAAMAALQSALADQSQLLSLE